MPKNKLTDPHPIELVATDQLYLDSKNPRLVGDDGKSDQLALLKRLWNEYSLKELVLSISKNGFFPEEPLVVVSEGGRRVVVEGNRRLAAVKLLRDVRLQAKIRATDIPAMAAASRKALDRLPVIAYPDRKSLWSFLGFRHVNGPLTWDSWSKAQYISDVHNNFGIDLDRIAESIGDENQTVRRLYRGLMVLNQAIRQAGYDLDDRAKQHLSFSHLYTGLDYGGFQKHLGLGKNDGFRPNPIDRAHQSNLKELMIWLFGSKAEERQPVVRTQNPDLKRLDDVLKDRKSLAALRSGLGLDVSHGISLGDKVRFRDALIRAKYELQQATGLIVQGYTGEADLLATAQDIRDLSEKVVDEMGKRMSGGRTRRGR